MNGDNGAHCRRPSNGVIVTSSSQSSVLRRLHLIECAHPAPAPKRQRVLATFAAQRCGSLEQEAKDCCAVVIGKFDQASFGDEATQPDQLTGRRQHEEWQRDATRHLATGRTGEAIAAYREHDNVHVAVTREKARRSLIDGWDRDRVANPESAKRAMA